MIYCVWYPSGGFGHYMNAVISLHGTNFARPKNPLAFGPDGNSHALDLTAPLWFKDPANYDFDFDPAMNYSVLIDNGINNQGTKFQEFFPDATIIKMCYTDFSWPVVANTMIVKAQGGRVEQHVSAQGQGWNTQEPWAQREKYFLFLRDHALRHAWKPDAISCPVDVETLIQYTDIKQRLNHIGIDLTDFYDLHAAWWNSNQRYFQPILLAKQFVDGEIDVITDLWTQAIVYYQIWCRYGVEVPHNDFCDFFHDQTHYQDWLGSVL